MTAAGSGDAHRRLRGREAKEHQARAAQDAAVQAFYRMDRAQRDIAVQVEAYTNIDADAPAARGLRREFRDLSTAADARAHRYLATLDAHPLDGEPSAEALGDAAHAFGAAAADLGTMASHLEAFATRNAGYFAQVGPALERAGARTAGAMAALARARSSVAALAETGTASAAADRALAEAEEAAGELARGTAAHGVSGIVALADAVRAAAERAHAVATDLPRRKAEIEQRLRSLRTRREALGHQAAGLPDVLRTLRRGYAEGCWADLVDTPERVRTLLAAADTEAERAARSARAADWDGAAHAVTRVVAGLDSAADLVTAATARAAALEGARRDPAARVAAARFTVRDAQRLVMTGRSLPPAPWAAQLDALAARLDRAERMLAGVHPDYWAFLRELKAVTDATAELVQRFRADPGM